MPSKSSELCFIIGQLALTRTRARPSVQEQEQIFRGCAFTLTTETTDGFVCIVITDVQQRPPHELQQVKKWTESKIMDAFEGAVALLGDQYGYSDAEGIPQYIQRGRIPVATGLKIRTEYQDIVEALSGEFEDEMLNSYNNDFRSFRKEFCVTRNKVCKPDAPQLNAAAYKPEGY